MTAFLTKSNTCNPEFKVPRIRSPTHLRYVASLPCTIPNCRNPNAPAHHLTIGPEPKARGLKAGDNWIIPLCLAHHAELHRRGDETAWWLGYNIDPLPICQKHWNQKCRVT